MAKSSTGLQFAIHFSAKHNARIIGLLVMLAAALRGQAAPDYLLGTWKANPLKTRLSPGTPDLRKSELMILDDMGIQQYRVTRTTQDGKSSTVGLYFDGRERFSDPTTSVIGIQLDPRHFRNTIKGPKGSLVSDWIVSSDGKVLTNTRKGVGTETGRAIDEVLVYDRRPSHTDKIPGGVLRQPAERK